MAHRTATLSAYDMFGQVHVTVTIRDHDVPGEWVEEPEYACSTTIQSTGESEPHEWLAQALLGLLESC